MVYVPGCSARVRLMKVTWLVCGKIGWWFMDFVSVVKARMNRFSRNPHNLRFNAWLEWHPVLKRFLEWFP